MRHLRHLLIVLYNNLYYTPNFAKVHTLLALYIKLAAKNTTFSKAHYIFVFSAPTALLLQSLDTQDQPVQVDVSPGNFNSLHGIHIVFQQGLDLPPPDTILIELKELLRPQAVGQRVHMRVGDQVVVRENHRVLYCNLPASGEPAEVTS